MERIPEPETLSVSSVTSVANLSHRFDLEACKAAVANAIADGRITFQEPEPEPAKKPNPRKGLPRDATPGSQAKRESNAWHAQKFREKNRANGLCIYCGDAPLPGRSKCARCTERMRLANEKRHHAFAAQGLCTLCGSHREDPDRQWCRACRANNARWKKKTPSK